MADKRDRRQIELGKLLEVDLVYSLGGCTGLDDVEQQMLAGGEVGPDAFRLRRRATDGRCSAHAGMIAGDHREDFDAAYVAVLKNAIGRPYVGEHAALARRYDHQLEMLGALFIDATRHRRRDVHL